MTSTSQPTRPTRAEKRTAKKNDPTRVSAGRILAWSSSHAAQAGNVLVLGYFAIYCTDTLKLNPAIVGVLLLLSKLVDAVGVLLSGWIVDRSPETRWGKARPYDLAIVGVWIFTAVMFSTPAALNDAGKYIWVFVTYLMITAIFTPLFLANQPLYMARVFSTREAITKVSAQSGIVIGLGGVLVGISFPIFVQQVGKDPGSWSLLVIAYAIPMILLGLVRFLTVKERHNTEDAGLPSVTFRDIRTVLATNPYLWGVAGIQFVSSLVGGLGALVYYYRYIVGNIALQGILGILAVALIPLFLLMPRLIKRFSVSKLIAASAVLGIIGFGMYSFAGTNIILLVVAAVFTAASSLPVSFLLPILIIDNATYNEWKGNRRLESVGGSVTAFAMNVGVGAAAAITGLTLAAFGYDGSKEVQSPAATTGIVVLNSWVPAALMLVVVFISLVYNRFERRLPTITQELNIIRASRATATVTTPAGQTITIGPDVAVTDIIDEERDKG